MSSHEWYSLDELIRRVGRDRRIVEKLVNRGRIPAHRVGGEWRFNAIEITHWLEEQLPDLSDDELADLEKSHKSEDLHADLPVSQLLTIETVQVPLEARTKRSVLESLIEVAGRTWQIWEPAAVLKAVQEREQVLSTALGDGVAIPHPRNPLPEALGESVIAYGRTYSGIPFGGPKRSLSDIFFLVLCRDSRTHLQLLARLSRMVQLPNFLDDLRASDDNQSSFELICRADEEIGG